MNSQITTLTLFKYSSFRAKVWAFGMMQKGHPYLRNTKDMSFYKLMGSGKVLGRPFPDWSVYGLLQVWKNEQSAMEFLKSSELMNSYRDHGKEQCTFFLKCTMVHGLWSKVEPFQVSQDAQSTELPVAAITRATIKMEHLFKFWNQAKKAQKPFDIAPGLIYSKGIGEFPISQMATFSLWENSEVMMNAVYSREEHKQAIRMTRQLNWYSEELFSRFSLYKVRGTWEDITDQLEDLGVAMTSIIP